MPGLATPKKEPAQPADRQVREWATRLYTALSTKRKLMRRPAMQKWHYELTKLREHSGPEEVERVLAWYCDHIGGDRVPLACSGKAFRDKFLNIQQACNIAKEKEAKVSAQSMRTPDGEKIWKWASRLRWPKGADAQLRSAVEESLANYEKFLVRIAGYRVAAPAGCPLARLAVHLRGFFGQPTKFFEVWWDRAFKSVKSWKQWSGNLNFLTFRVGSELLNRLGRDEAKRYCGTAARWDDLLKKLED